MLSCLQNHQLTGTQEGAGADGGQLLVPPEDSGREEGMEA